MTDPLIEPKSHQAMREGMEGLIAVMKDRRPDPQPDAGQESTVLACASADGADPLANAPWHATTGMAERFSALEQGTAVGRYVVLRELGAGAMGVVYAAYDPDLDRKVALKVVRPGAAGPSGSARLLREAQALAKLSHPNVVTIHDTGTVGAEVWLAMEFVSGQTLRQWLASPRRWQQVLALMLEAGRGLVAAHAASLLHRDFKPDNVMVGDDGRVRVMDFGLARAHARTVDDEVETALSERDTLALPITRAGAMVGTPGYMAPEQFDGEELTSAADQFAFCVTVWEALYGQRPFAGKTWMEIAANVHAGRRVPPRRRGVPVWLLRACERGLSADPKQRWPTMQALLDTLARGRTRARARTGIASLGVLVLCGAAVEAHRRYDIASRTAACNATGDEIDDVWSPERAKSLREGLLATGVSYASTTADKVVPWLDQHAAAWREARVEACLNADVRATWDAYTLDRSLWCLDERRMRFAAFVESLTTGGEGVVPKAVVVAAGLPLMDDCRNAMALESLAMPPERDREAIRGVRSIAAQSQSAQMLGRYDEGLVLAREALARARALDWRPILASTKLQLGWMLDETGDFAGAEVMLEEAYFDATEGTAPNLEFDAAIELASVIGTRSGRHADGLRWGRLAKAALADLHDGEGLDEATLSTTLATIHESAGHYDEAVRLHREALAIYETTLGHNHPLVATTLSNLSAPLHETGQYDEARDVLVRALAIYETTLGPDHPHVAGTLVNLAIIERTRGVKEQAKALYQRALPIMVTARGPDHADVTALLGNLAIVEFETGDVEGARARFEEVLAIRKRTLGDEHPLVASSMANLANVLLGTGDLGGARRLLERAIVIHEKALGPEHPSVATDLQSLADVLLAAGDHDEAIDQLARALAILQAKLGAEHPRAASVRSVLQELQQARKEPRAASK